MSKEEYILVEYDGGYDCYGAIVYTIALMTEKEWSEIKDYAEKNPYRYISCEKLGGRSSDSYDILKNIVKNCKVYKDPKKIDAFEILYDGEDYAGNVNIFEYFDEDWTYEPESEYNSD